MFPEAMKRQDQSKLCVTTKFSLILLVMSNLKNHSVVGLYSLGKLEQKLILIPYSPLRSFEWSAISTLNLERGLLIRKYQNEEHNPQQQSNSLQIDLYLSALVKRGKVCPLLSLYISLASYSISIIITSQSAHAPITLLSVDLIKVDVY